MSRNSKKSTGSDGGNNGGPGAGHAPGLAKRPRRDAVRTDAKPVVASGVAHVLDGVQPAQHVAGAALNMERQSISELVYGKPKRGKSYAAKKRIAAVDAHVALRRESGLATATVEQALDRTLAYAEKVMAEQVRQQMALKASPQFKLRQMGTELRNLIGQTVYSPRIEARTADQQDALEAAIRAVDLASSALLDLRRITMRDAAHA